MAKDGDGRRFPGAPLPLGALIPGVTRPAFRKRSPGGAQVLADWAQIVGPALAAVTSPLRLSAGTLTLACAGPVAMELQHLAPELIGRINGHLGRVTVERLRFVQQAAGGARPSVAPARPDAPVPTGVRARLEALPEGDLRQALENLARGVYRKG
ncbi:DUF721 domain-containing protein [Falsiroseomonas oryzae]|uniref:DUF721 domain-containing protein n=1 Tax=Falsiroseomonas oryzae TaxID=2766473 RepID=UPI0022EB9C09|nr:DciA family protein [Roseomonas sp. MO-31]